MKIFFRFPFSAIMLALAAVLKQHQHSQMKTLSGRTCLPALPMKSLSSLTCARITMGMKRLGNSLMFSGISRELWAGNWRFLRFKCLLAIVLASREVRGAFKPERGKLFSPLLLAHCLSSTCNACMFYDLLKNYRVQEGIESSWMLASRISNCASPPFRVWQRWNTSWCEYV